MHMCIYTYVCIYISAAAAHVGSVSVFRFEIMTIQRVVFLKQLRNYLYRFDLQVVKLQFDSHRFKAEVLINHPVFHGRWWILTGSCRFLMVDDPNWFLPVRLLHTNDMNRSNSQYPDALRTDPPPRVI